MNTTTVRTHDRQDAREAEARKDELAAKMREIKAEIGKIRAGLARVHACW